jgi:hypothetical protein
MSKKTSKFTFIPLIASAKRPKTPSSPNKEKIYQRQF